jgi:hypothetical protein
MILSNIRLAIREPKSLFRQILSLSAAAAKIVDRGALHLEDDDGWCEARAALP